MSIMTDQQTKMGCPPWCVIPAEVHEREWADNEGYSHWSGCAVNDGPQAAVCTESDGRVYDGPHVFFRAVEPITPAQATVLAHQLLAAAAMCAEVTPR